MADAPSYHDGQDIRNRSFEFACAILEFCKCLYEQGGVARQVASQLINCATSVAGMLEEARAAEAGATSFRNAVSA